MTRIGVQSRIAGVLIPFGVASSRVISIAGVLFSFGSTSSRVISHSFAPAFSLRGPTTKQPREDPLNRSCFARPPDRCNAVRRPNAIIGCDRVNGVDVALSALLYTHHH